MFSLKKKPPRSSARSRVSTLTHLFHGIEIVPGPHSCSAVRDLAKQRLLSEEAPLLPLAECAGTYRCSCKYRHFVDRRTDTRRESDEGLPARVHAEDKRSGSGRRITDG